MKFLHLCLSAILAFLSVSCVKTVGRSESERVSWFQEARYGVMVHFLGEGPDWNGQVNAFDVEVFAEQMESAKAGYVIFTLGQNSGYYCSPNATYDRYAGYEAGDRCST